MRNSSPFRSTSDWGDWMVGAVAAVAVAAAVLWAVAWADARDDRSVADARTAESLDVPDSPGPTADAMEPGGDATGTVVVFACEHGGRAIYSDQPCGEDSERREIDVLGMNTYTPVPPSVRSPGGATPASNAGAH